MTDPHDRAENAIAKPAFWKNSKRYYDFKSFLKNTFGCPVAKLSVDAGFTCPNRDGTRGRGGCIYCDGRGSRWRQQGDLPSVTEQLTAAREHYRTRGFEKFIAYFQTFTNTYGPVEDLRRLYDEAVSFSPDLVGLSIGTRPDSVPDEVLDLLAGYRSRLKVWLEFGFQSFHGETLNRINRGHTVEESFDAVERTAARGLDIVGHVILGLPGETPEIMRSTAETIATLPLAGLKIHLLLVLEGTPLAEQYRKGELVLPSLQEYTGWVCDFLEIIPPTISIQRLTADGYRDIFIAPEWAQNKLAVLNAIDAELKRRDSWQGKNSRP